jgi:hypothetical protein
MKGHSNSELKSLKVSHIPAGIRQDQDLGTNK